MTVTLAAGETLFVAATTASSSDTTTMTRMTAARGLLAEILRALLTIPTPYQGKMMKVQGNRILCQYYHWSLPKVRGVRVGIITAEDAALLRILAVKGRETAMVPMTGVSMTVTQGAGETWCAAATTASSSDTTTMTRMTAARGLLVFNKTHMLHINITFHH